MQTPYSLVPAVSLTSLEVCKFLIEIHCSYFTWTKSSISTYFTCIITVFITFFVFYYNLERSTTTCKRLLETTYGLVVVYCGNPAPLSQTAENCFRFLCDSISEDVQSNSSQKPVAFFKRLTELFTATEDWVLDGLSGTGRHVLH